MEKNSLQPLSWDPPLSLLTTLTYLYWTTFTSTAELRRLVYSRWETKVSKLMFSDTECYQMNTVNCNNEQTNYMQHGMIGVGETMTSRVV